MPRRFFRTDVTSEDGVAANVAAAQHAMGGLNVVINCAGILGAGRVLGKEGPMPLANFAEHRDGEPGRQLQRRQGRAPR